MHYYIFKPKDYMSKTAFLEPLEDLAYRRMLDHCYLTENPLPEDINEIAMLIRMRSHTDSIKVVLHYFFDLTAEGYVNDYVVREISNYHNKSIKAKASADARWSKKRNKDNGLDGDANALRYKCESNANQQPITNNQQPLTNNNISDEKPKKKNVVKKFNPKEMDLPNNVNPDLWCQFVDMRSDLKKKLPERSAKMILSELEGFGITANESLSNAIKSTWLKPYAVKQNNSYQTSNQKTASEQDVWRQAYEESQQQNEIDVTPQGYYLNG